MHSTDPTLIDVPLPIRTPRLLIRSKQPGDGALTAAAVAETWDDLHEWMIWAERLEDNTAEKQEIRTRHVMAQFILRQELNLVGIEIATGEPVIWCGFHHLDWPARQCETGYWVRKTAQGRGFATECTHALLRFAFGPLTMRRVGLACAEGNYRSRRVAEKLGFVHEGVLRTALPLPGGRLVDKHVYARLDAENLSPLEVTWGPEAKEDFTADAHLAARLRGFEEQLLDPEFRKDREAVSGLLAEDFREIGSSGRIHTRSGILDLLADEAPTRLFLTEFACERLSPAVCLVTYRSHHTDVAGAGASCRRSSLWVRKNEGWRLQFHQGTKE